MTEHPLLKIKDCLIGHGWDLSLLERLVGHQKASELCHFLARRKDGEDVLIWLKNNDENFTTKSAWDCIRVRAFPLLWTQWIWYNHIHKKIYIMMCKATHNCLSVDEKIRTDGISMVSKCNCCSMGHSEDLDHVLYNGEFARKI